MGGEIEISTESHLWRCHCQLRWCWLDFVLLNIPGVTTVSVIIRILCRYCCMGGENSLGENRALCITIFLFWTTLSWRSITRGRKSCLGTVSSDGVTIIMLDKIYHLFDHCSDLDCVSPCSFDIRLFVLNLLHLCCWWSSRVAWDI